MNPREALLAKVAGPVSCRQDAGCLRVDRAQRLQPLGDQVGHPVVALDPASDGGSNVKTSRINPPNQGISASSASHPL